MDLLWILGYRSRGYRKRRALVEAAVAAGDIQSAIEMLHQQERASRPNWANGSRKSHILDLDHLIWIFTVLSSLSPRPELDQALRAAHAHRNLLADRTNFGIDGRMMKRKAAVATVKLNGELELARKAVRAAFSDASSPKSDDRDL